MDVQLLESTVCAGYQSGKTTAEVKQAVHQTIELLDQGKIRVAEKTLTGWVVHGWIREAILLYFRIAQLHVLEAGPLEFHDKIPLKKNYAESKVRVVPHAIARYGSFLEPGVILMPSYVNIGAYVGAGTLIDTWATVGSCAQIGQNVHLSGGVGVGGVLEPPGAKPVIIEDGAFIGSRCVLVEGVHIEEEAVLGANVVITSSTKIIDVSGPQAITLQGKIPARSVVIPGTLPKTFAAGTYHVPCALIIGKRKETTDQKTSLNQVLREYELSV
jgi:2,3,4,5-tetrahydropyridine-2-carboxylate N-succinyltransferase